MHRFLLYITPFILFSTFNLAGQGTELKLIFAGDIMGHDSQIASANEGQTYNYDTCFSLIKPLLENTDIAIANLEVTLAGEPFKGYPQFSSPDELAISARNAGFDVFITANNHALDRRKQGLERTIQILDKENIIHTGTFNDSLCRAKSYPLIIEKNGIRIAILNYTYSTNGIKLEEPNIVNYIDREIIKKDLEKAGLAKPDFTIVTIHWGTEYQRNPNTEQQELAKFILNNGANAIIGSHPHVIQTINTIKIGEEDKLVVYSLGNFISNQRKRYTDGGMLFDMTLKKENSICKIDEYNYHPVWVYKPKNKAGKEYFVITPSNRDKEFYDTLGMSPEDYAIMKIFNDDTVGHLEE